jgi:integrase
MMNKRARAVSPTFAAPLPRTFTERVSIKVDLSPKLRMIRFHDLRHTFASLLMASGEDIVRVSRVLGQRPQHPAVPSMSIPTKLLLRPH